MDFHLVHEKFGTSCGEHLHEGLGKKITEENVLLMPSNSSEIVLNFKKTARCHVGLSGDEETRIIIAQSPSNLG